MKFRKKPVVIEAMLFDGENHKEIDNFIGPHGVIRNILLIPSLRYIEIDTLEGVMRASVGDWIIKGIKNEFYPCKPDIFEATYEAVE